MHWVVVCVCVVVHVFAQACERVCMVIVSLTVCVHQQCNSVSVVSMAGRIRSQDVQTALQRAKTKISSLEQQLYVK